MAESQHSSHENEDLYTSVVKQLDEILKSCTSIKGPITRYILNTTTVKEERSLKRVRFGNKDESKPHKTILLVGETGKGKSTLINAIVNYMLGVKWEKKIWCELIETKPNKTAFQTEAVTVYDVYVKESEFSLTLIDTPGFKSTEGPKEDIKIAAILNELFSSKDGVLEIDAVCFVISASDKRLTENLEYIFDAVLSLFGNDVEKNIVLLITHCHTKPTHTINTIKKSRMRYATTNDKEPVFFQFDNSVCETFNDDSNFHRYLWDENEKSMKNFFTFITEIKPINMKITVTVLRKRNQLCNLKDRITHTELRKKELHQTKEALKKNTEMKDVKNFEYEVDEPYKEKVPIQSEWWHLSKEATCCSVCKENCHYPGCWWVRDVSWCSMMEKGKCTVCTGKCYYTKHVKEGKIYVLKTRRVKKTHEDLKKKYEKEIREKNSLISRIQEDIEALETEKIKLIDEGCECIAVLEEIALNTDSFYALQHLDYLIEKVKEIGKTDKAKDLEELKKRAEAANKSLLDFLKFWKQ